MSATNNQQASSNQQSNSQQAATPARQWNKVKLNHAQRLLTADQLRRLPEIYSQDGKGADATCYVHFFGGIYDFYATEFDPVSGEFFGLIYNAAMADQEPRGMLGYFTARDLIAMQIPLRLRITDGSTRVVGYSRCERDLHFERCTIADVQRKLYPPAASPEAATMDGKCDNS